MSCSSSRIMCSLFFFIFLLSSSGCHALTVDEGEQVAMVIDKIENAEHQRQEHQQQEQRNLQEGEGPVSVASEGSCFSIWTEFISNPVPLTNNTAVYLCDGFSDAMPGQSIGGGVPYVIPANIDVTISCLGICVVTGGSGGFQVQAGGRLDLFGIDFVNVDGPVATVSGANAFLGIASCSFSTGGRALGEGNGGVFVAELGGVLTVMGSTFTGNQADNGGVFSVQSSSALIVKDSTFEFNKALQPGNAAFGGGVVHMRRASTAQFTNCNFDSNESASNGGVADVNDNLSKIKFVDCQLKKNSALIRGGAIHAKVGGRFDLGGTVDIIGNSEINNNRARYGGAIDARSAYIVTIQGPPIGWIVADGNKANGDVGGFARTSNNAQLIIDRVDIRNSIAKGPGGAIHLDSSAPFNMTYSIMESNIAGGNGQRGKHIYGTSLTTFGNDVCSLNSTNAFINPSATEKSGIFGVNLAPTCLLEA